MITKYHQHGSLDRLKEMFIEEKIERTFPTRLQMAKDYLSIMNYLHGGPHGTHVMCDSNDLIKTLSQYLITDDLRLVVNDLDALPKVVAAESEDGGDSVLIKCGARQLFGHFVAPEQLWPYPDEEFNDEEMDGYDEKTDVWKIPDVLIHLLGREAKGNLMKFRLFKLFKRCKNMDPALRPAVAEIKSTFDEVWREVEKSDGKHIEL